jgi:acyl transferase domain-containing protein
VTRPKTARKTSNDIAIYRPVRPLSGWGAKDVEAFWQNLRDGVESISFFSEGELEVLDPTLLASPNYVKAGAALPNIEQFDASFFGYSAFDAEMMDPQHRIFLECAWEALESAGYNPETYPRLIGVYAGSGMNTYFHAVIKGSAINNDGAFKVGYTAPSVEGQTQVISSALARANIDPSTITYVEAHGTGTGMGDPIEIMALTQAFRQNTPENGFCAVGSVKKNIGHLIEASGISGMIKTVLALKHKQLPPSLHFNQPNPSIDFANKKHQNLLKLKNI